MKNKLSSWEEYKALQEQNKESLLLQADYQGEICKANYHYSSCVLIEELITEGRLIESRRDGWKIFYKRA